MAVYCIINLIFEHCRHRFAIHQCTSYKTPNFYHLKNRSRNEKSEIFNTSYLMRQYHEVEC